MMTATIPTTTEKVVTIFWANLAIEVSLTPFSVPQSDLPPLVLEAPLAPSDTLLAIVLQVVVAETVSGTKAGAAKVSPVITINTYCLILFNIL